mmetsp:Transcript_3358/g.8548  ORF Transcript_3358/g.8548 Transcript_3358/m.8548 type:complete len:315 (-) Transcript_3358:64-1008(-)
MSFLNDDDIGRLTCLNIGSSSSSGWHKAGKSKSNPSSRPLCRFHFLQGNCRYKGECAFSHSLPEGVTMMEVREHIPCPFFLRGNCKYGEYCELRHDSRDLPPNKNAPETNDSTTTNPNEEDGSSQVCGICLENVTEAGHKFGLLSCCQHTFCFECLMEWRKEGTKEARDRRCCPTCRKTSNYVIPSVVMAASAQEKQRIVHEYRTKLSQIPCKFYPDCPFGKDCFYAHLDEKGHDCKHKDKTMQQLYEMRHQQRSSQSIRRSTTRDLQDDIDIITHMFLLHGLAFRGGLGYDDESDDDSEYDVWDDYDYFAVHH